MLVYLLFYALVQTAPISCKTVHSLPLAASTSELSFPSAAQPHNSITNSTKRGNGNLVAEFTVNSIEPGSASLESNSSAKITGDGISRRGHERDLMVVLPVMQGNSDLTNSNLQMLYTKPPVTAIIGEDPKHYKQEDARTTIKMIEKRVDSEIPKQDTSDHHPYTEFLFSKAPAKTSKSPLDYGYPESFKFVQELNELPKNHKPEWAMPDVQDVIDKSKVTTTGPTKGDPFQMFESVKPLEINKLLSFRPAAAAVTDSIIEESSTKMKHETTEEPLRTKRPPQKRLTKKPQKVKHTPQKLTEADLSLLTTPTITAGPTVSWTATTSTTTTTTSAPPLDLDSDYTAARYSTLFSETTKTFLPTPYVGHDHVATLIREIAPRSTSQVPVSSTTATTTTTTTLMPNFQWVNTSTNVSTTEEIPAKTVVEVKPSDLVSLTKILGENFEPKIEPLKDITTKSPFPDDMLTNDMKNMLIALGILKSEVPSTTSTEKTTTENYLFNIFGKKDEPVAPTIDPNAYISFKKMPIDFEKPRDRAPVSDDMRDLLASFGLLPKKSNNFGNSILTRISRQHDLRKIERVSHDTNSTETNSTLHDEISSTPSSTTSHPEVAMLPEEMKGTLENLGLLQPLAYHYQPHRNGHVFQPTVHLEQLGDEQKVQKINEAIDTIRKLSMTKDADSLSIEEIQKQLENVTAFLREENSTDLNRDLTKPNVTLSNEIMMKIIEDAKKVPHIEQTSHKTYDFVIERGRISNIEPTSTESHGVRIIEREKVPNAHIVEREKVPSPDQSLTDFHNITIIEPEFTLEGDENLEEFEEVKTEKHTTPTEQTSQPGEIRTAKPNTPSTEEISLKPDVVDKIVEVIQRIPTIEDSSNHDVNYTSDESVISLIKFNTTKNHSTELNLVMNPPNPLSPEELQQLLEFNKNDFKRQQPDDNSTLSVESETTVASAETSSTESSSTESSSTESSSTESSSTESPRAENTQSNSAPIADLADSFGGGETASEEAAVEDPPTPQPNGLYFYLDWNTFLNVGEADKNPVRIRFSPRAGNPRNFLNITVP